MFRWFCAIFIVINVTAFAKADKCDTSMYSSVPRSVYNDLRCVGVDYPALDSVCPLKYDCSNIYDRPADTCHFQGKTYKIGERIDDQELQGVWAHGCTCTEKLDFECPPVMDGCAEDMDLGRYLSPGCYLRYKLNSYCADGQVCPPFEENAKCEANGVTYKEGEKFTHPNERCVQCICDKAFDGKFEAPFCQPVNCTAEIKHSKAINDHCAPYYDHEEDRCCPKTWVCPIESGKFSSSPVGTPSNQPASEFSCKFGDHIMNVWDYYEHEDEELGHVYCQCSVPPFANCHKPAKPIILNK